MSPEAPILTEGDVIRRVALLHAAMDEYEMKAIEESATRAKQK